jgi:hypothetical protein
MPLFNFPTVWNQEGNDFFLLKSAPILEEFEISASYESMKHTLSPSAEQLLSSFSSTCFGVKIVYNCGHRYDST